MTVLYAIPTLLLLILAIAAALLVACGGQVVVHRRFRDEDFVDDNDVAGFIITVVGTLYAVVLGFITVVTWQQYDGTRERLALETASVADAWHNAVGLPGAARRELRRDMVAYASEMLGTEWPLMRSGHFSPKGDALIMDATTAVGEAAVTAPRAVNAQAATLRLLTDLHDARARRIESNAAGLSWFEWLVLVLGAAVVVMLCWLFGVRNPRSHMAMTGSVAVIVATMFVLVFELQYPFRSDLGITSAPWSALLEHIRMMDASPMPGMRM